MLVAISVFSVLGLLLVTMLRRVLDAWHTGDEGREVIESARRVTGQLSADLASAFTQKNAAEQRRDIVMYCDKDTNGRQRLMFVRTMGDELKDVRTRDGGTASAASGQVGYYTGKADAAALRALGGLAEVCYAIGSESRGSFLYRALRAPIGHAGSLFSPDALDTDSELEAAGQLLSESVLHLGYEFYTRVGTAEGRWTDRWDSTRGVLRDFILFRDGSLDDPSDDVWPWSVRIELVLRRGARERMPTLQKAIAQADRTIEVSDTRGMPDPTNGPAYCRVEDEWIEYSSFDAQVINVKTRGARGTKARDHGLQAKRVVRERVVAADGSSAIADVTRFEPVRAEWGETFRAVRDLPVVGDSRR